MKWQINSLQGLTRYNKKRKTWIFGRKKTPKQQVNTVRVPKLTNVDVHTNKNDRYLLIKHLYHRSCTIQNHNQTSTINLKAFLIIKQSFVGRIPTFSLQWPDQITFHLHCSPAKKQIKGALFHGSLCWKFYQSYLITRTYTKIHPTPCIHKHHTKQRSISSYGFDVFLSASFTKQWGEMPPQHQSSLPRHTN